MTANNRAVFAMLMSVPQFKVCSTRRLGPLLMALCAAAIAVEPVSAASRKVDAGDAFGRTYYIDGAGNWGFGVAEVSDGLKQAGYKGRVINYRWSPTLNPALDQTIGRPIAHGKGTSLGEEINKYLAQYPGREVNIIALSAGTGVAVWACEAVRPPAKVHNLVLLGSSISSDYDMDRALSNISGGVFVYYSGADGILGGPVRALGTIDGKLGVEPAGLVGLHPPRKSDKVHNIAWSSKYEAYGWTGAHTDATNEVFVRRVLAPRHILPQPDQAAPAEGHAAASPAK
jgi:hypothetical protein